MKLSGAKRLKAKIEAREWLLAAVQNYKVIPEKQTEREIKKFISRIQRDLKQMKRSEVEANLTIQNAEIDRGFERAVLSQGEGLSTSSCAESASHTQMGVGVYELPWV